MIQVSIRALSLDSSSLVESSNLVDIDASTANDEQPSLIIKSAKDVRYFDSSYENNSNFTAFIVNVERHVFYRDVYVFVDRLKDLVKEFIDEQRIKKLVSDCFRDSSLIWYSTELIELEKNLLRDAIIDQWSNTLIKRFKQRDATALQALQSKKYTLTNARNERTSRVYVQDIMRHAKAAEFFFDYNQMLMTWNNLDLDFKMQIFESIINITLNFFLDALDSKAIIWQKIIVRRSNHDANNSNDTFTKANRQLSKQNRRQSNDFSQRFVASFDFSSQSSTQSFVSWSQDYTSYQFQNFAYQNQKYQFRQSNNEATSRVVSFVLSQTQSRHSLRIISKNESNSSTSQNSNQDSKQKKKFNSRDKESNDRFQRKSRAYVADEKDENHEWKDSYQYQAEFVEDFASKNQDQDDYYANEDEMNYWNSKYNIEMNVDESFALFISSLNTSQCRRCKSAFSFNNQLHRHLRKASCITSLFRKSFVSSAVHIFIKTSDKSSSKLSSIAINSKSFAIKISSIATTKRNSVASLDISVEIDLSVVESSIDLDSNIDIDYEFKDWTYAKLKVTLSKQIFSKKKCLDIDVDLILINRVFLKRQASDLSIRIMTTSLSIRDLDTTQHKTTKYAIILMYLNDEDNFDRKIRACFHREIHIVDDLKVNILIDIDVIDAENIIIDIESKIARIDNYNVIISIEVCNSQAEIAMQKLVHLRKTIIVSSHSKLTIEIHNFNVSDKDFLFESDEILFLTVYAHMIDISIKAIVMRNDFDQVVQIFRNQRLERLIELEYLNAYLIDQDETNELRELAVRQSKFKHQHKWFDKLIAECATIFVAITIVDNNSSNIKISLQQASCFHDYENASINMSRTSANLSKSVAKKIVLLNDVIIHDFDENAIRSLT